MNEFDPDRARDWRPTPPDTTPLPESERRRAPDSFHYALRHRVASMDLEPARVTREMQAWQWRDDVLVAHETWSMAINPYSREQIVGALSDAGFGDVTVVGGYHGLEPTGDERFLVYRATAP